ncbi:MAG: hypothetical protein AB1941_04855 [Gemmatimonadota bacterium]
MKRANLLKLGATSAVASLALAAACNGSDPVGPKTDVVVQAHSVTPALVKGLPAGVRAYPLISSDDALPGSPGFVFGGSADGMGLQSNPDGTYTLLVNHEDNFSVSRIRLDRTFKPLSGEYVLDSDNGRWRLCSATLATPEIHGFSAYITVGESSAESMIHALDPNGAPNTSRLLAGLGKWNSENAVPLPKTAYPDRTVILIGDDDSGTYGGQVAMYVGGSVGDLEGGSLYVMARADDNVVERDMQPGRSYPVVFRRIENQRALTGAQINARTAELRAIQFGRVEDLDYRKGTAGREVYFNVTGQDDTGANAGYTRSKFGRVYRLVLDGADPTRGTLEVILDGDDRSGPARTFQNPDNILVTSNYVYIQEDPNGYKGNARAGDDETHDAYVYQYDIASRQLKVVMELDHRRDDAKYNVGGASGFGDWEYGAMLDVSDQLGVRDAFLLAIQPHTWRGDRYRAPDGGTARPNENQASQVLLVTGLPR